MARDTSGDNRHGFGSFELDLAAHQLTCDGRMVPLTSGEFDLLSILVTHPNKVLDRDRILDLLTGAERSPFDRSIDVRVTRLRSKIESDPSKPVFIKTIWGKGYMFCPEGND
jgi:DNA-binding response OmpR family regulator